MAVPRQSLSLSPRGLAAPGPAGELAFVFALACVLVAAIPMLHDGLSISWDALNHQVYLGWTAGRARFDLDVLPAAWQSYQYPYLYWPLYKLATSGASGVGAGMALGALQLAHVPALWIVARRCVPDTDWFGMIMRTLSLVLAFAGALVLSLLDSTSNDMLAAVPLVWAFAIAFVHATPVVPPRHPHAALLGAAFLAGIAVAFKFSNGPLALLLPGLWLLAPGPAAQRLLRASLGCAVLVSSFLVAYAPWGAQLWHWYGNPFYPMGETWFAPVRVLLGWQAA